MQLGLALQHAAAGQRVVPSCSPARQPARVLPVARFLHHHNDPGRSRFPPSEGLPLSLFHRFKGLPPDGTTLPAEEELCDPEEENCKTLMHVYEARCTACSGSGWSRAPSNGRRGHLCTCMVCHGLGYVRRTTSRFCPDDPDKHMTIARPLRWNGKLPARLSRPPSSNGHSSAAPGSSNGSSTHGGAPSNGKSPHP